MAITVKHSKVSTIPDDADTSLVRPSDWNADHTLTGTVPVANGGTGAATASDGLNNLLPSQTGNNGKVLATDGTNASWTTNGSGDVVGPSSATDNAIARYDGTTGKLIQNSGVTVDDNSNITANAVFEGFSNTAASGTQIVLTVASVPSYVITGSGGQTIKLPDATTLPNGTTFAFNNNQSSGAITVNNNSNTLVVSIPSGAFTIVTLLSNSIAAGSWDTHDQAPSNVSWSTNTFNYVGSITGATWNGNTVQVNRGGTGAATLTGLVVGNGTSAMTTVTAPSGTVVGTSDTQTLTNKSISGSTNTLSNIGNSSLTNSAITINGTSTSLGGSVSVGTVTSVTGTSPVVSSGGATPAISMPAATTSVNGYLTSTDWTTFNNKGSGTVTSVTATSPVTSTGGTTPVIAMPAATGSVDGYLTSADWTTFNGKGSGTVTSVGQSFTGGLISVSGSPVTSSGTLALTVAGTSGGIPYFSNGTNWASSAALTQYGVVYGGGAGAAPVATAAGTTGQVLTATTGGAPTWATPSGSGTVTSVGLTAPAMFTVTGSPVTSSGTLALTYSGTALPVANGGTGSTTAAGANANLQGFTTTATAAGTTALTNTSTYYQYFSGSTTQTITLPLNTTIQNGWSFHIANNSTGNLTVNSNSGALVITILPQTTGHVTCVDATVNTAAAWDSGFTDFGSVTGTGANVLATAPTFTTSIDGGATFSAFSSCTALTIGNAPITGSNTINIGTGTTNATFTKTINIGTGAKASATTAINLGSSTGSSTTTITGGLSQLSGIFSWDGSGSGPQFMYAAQGSGNITLGAAAATGNLTLGLSTATNTTNIQAGITASGSTKTMNIGTAGASGSTTTIAIGSTTGTSTTTVNGILKQQTYTVATLPSASTSGVGSRSFVTDALAPAFGATVATGGAIAVPVYSDGTNWKVG